MIGALFAARNRGLVEELAQGEQRYFRTKANMEMINETCPEGGCRERDSGSRSNARICTDEPADDAVGFAQQG
jgi:hypothetical protein